MGSKSTFLSSVIHMSFQAVGFDLFSSAAFLPYFSMLILSLPLIGLGSKSTSLSPGFCVRRLRHNNIICKELDIISRFFVLFLADSLGG